MDTVELNPLADGIAINLLTATGMHTISLRSAKAKGPELTPHRSQIMGHLNKRFGENTDVVIDYTDWKLHLKSADKLDEKRRKNLGLNSIEIRGMDTSSMLAWWKLYQATGGRDTSLSKGTRFLGKDSSIYGFAAGCLKTGIPSDVQGKVKMGVKSAWGYAEVIAYARAIKVALDNAGFTQVDKDYLQQMHPEWFSKIPKHL